MRADATSSSNRRTYIKTIGTGVTAMLAGCSNMGGGGGGGTTTSGGGKSPDEIVIGANHPLSGSLSRAGQAMSNATKLAAQHVNDGVAPGFKDGGIPNLDGATLKVKTGDNKGKQELGGEVEKNLIEQGAVAVTGCYSSPVSLSAAQIAEREQVPHVIDVSVADRILQEREMRYTYRVSPNAKKFVQDYANFITSIAKNNNKKLNTASIVYIDTAFGQGINKHLKTILPQNNIKIASNQAYSYGQSSMDTEATKVKQAKADAFVFVGYGTGGTRMMKSFQNVNYRPPLLTGTSTPTFTSSEVINQIGKFANGGLGNNYDFNFNLDWTNTIFSDYKKKFGKKLDVIHTVMSYTATITLAHAINEAGSSDPKKINKALESIEVKDHPAAAGPVTFRKDGENKNGLAPMLQVQNLKADIVHPKKYQQSKPKF